MARKGSRVLNTLGIAVIVAAVIAICVVIALIIGVLRSGERPGGPVLPGTAQPAHCPDVQVISIPGTWESSPADDPISPTFNPNALMLKVTGPLQQQYPPARAAVYTVPYAAQFHNPVAIPPDGQMTYAASRRQGTDVAEKKMREVATECGLTEFIVMGFSQGATIAGNIAASIGAGQGPIEASRLLGAGLISDSRRVRGQGVAIGPDPDGQGVEVLFGGINFMGVDLEGKRKNGFGSVNDKVATICGANDPICNQPDSPISNLLGGIGQLASVITQNSHALYATTTDWSLNGQSATTWMTGWASGLIAGAPRPPHN